jgi:hypothetical protein
MEKIIYTALAGKKSIVRQPWKIDKGWRYICFTDQGEEDIPDPWEVWPLKKISEDPNRNAKQYKILPHRFLPGNSINIWMDANFRIKESLDTLISDKGLVLFKHFERNCLYDEAEICKSMNLDNPSIIDSQINRYREEGFPENFGPFPECGIQIRKNSPLNKTFLEFWWSEVIKGSRRDQLSFMYSVWKIGPDLMILPETTRQNKWFEWLPHLRMDQLYKV